MANIVSRKQMMDLLTEEAKLYVKNAKASVHRSRHMHEYKKGKIPQALVEAVVVDFVNSIGRGQGLDWGLYTHYLHDEEPDPLTQEPNDNVSIQLRDTRSDLGDLSKRLFDRAKILKGNNTLKSAAVVALEEVASVLRQASWVGRKPA